MSINLKGIFLYWSMGLGDIKNIVANTIAGTILALLFLFAFTWIIFDFQSSANSLKDTWSIVSSLFGGLTTLAASYVALLIYSGWKNIEKFKAIQDLHQEAVTALLISSKSLNKISGYFAIIEAEKEKGVLTEEKKEELSISFNQVVKEVVIETQDITFNACVKIAMAYTRPLNNDADLKFMFDTLNDVKNFVQKIAHEKGVGDKNYKYVLDYINRFNLSIDLEMHKRNIDKTLS